MKARRLILALIAMVFSVSSVLAEVESGKCGENATYTLDTETGLLKVEGTGDMYTYNYPWATNSDFITKVEITAGITNIGDIAFQYCTNLTSVVIPESVTSIGNSAFEGCCNLPSVTIPESVTNIGYKAFLGCHFTTENFKNMSKRKSSDNWGAKLYDIEQEDGLMIKNGVAEYCRRWATSVIIPNSVTSIGSSAFAGCWGLTSVIIPNSITSIGNSAFSGCSSLTSVNIPSTVISIGNSAFSGCSSLTSITIPNSVTRIEESVFSACSSMTTIFIPNSVTSIRQHAFSSCYSLTSITIPESVSEIGYSAFSGCYFTKENFKNTSGCTPSDSWGNTNWGATFCDFEQEDGLMIKDGVAVFCRQWATTVSIPESVTSLKGGAFFYCSNLTSVTIPSSITNIDSYVFSGCRNVTELIFAEGCTTALKTGLTSVTSVAIPSSVTAIEASAFKGCSALDYICIPSSVTSIEDNAFSDCAALTSVTIPESVVSIGRNAFSGCKLRNLRCQAIKPPMTDKSSFSEQTRFHTTLYVPNGTWDDYAYDDAWYLFINIREEITNTEDVNMENVYTLMNSETMTYMVYDPVNDRVREVPSVTNIDEGNMNHSWMAASVDGQMYLYNMGAGRFVRPTANGFELVEGKIALDAENGKEGILLQGNSQQWSLVKNENMFPKDDVVDAITLTPSAESPETYDLQGRKVKNARNGLFIQNGRVVLMK